MSWNRKSLQAPQAFLTTTIVWLLCMCIQWFLNYELVSDLDGDRAIVSFLANTALLIGTLVLTDRFAVHLLLITPQQRPLLLLLQTMLVVPLISFFVWSPAIWALPCLVGSLHLQLLCYSRSERLQTLTLAGLTMGIAVLLYPPLLWTMLVSLPLLAFLKIRRTRAYCAYLWGFLAVLWLALPTLYLLLGEAILLRLYGELKLSLQILLNPTNPFDWIGWGLVVLLLLMSRIGLETIRGGSHVVTWYRQRTLLIMAMILLLVAIVWADSMRYAVLLAVPLVVIPMTPWADQLDRNAWRYLLPLLGVLVMVLQLLLAGILI